MPKTEQKQAVVNEIKEKLDKASSVVLIDGRGLTVHQDTSLRRKLREVGVDYKVYKNTLVNLAFKDTPYEELSGYLAGPTSLAISYDDPTAAARVLSKEQKALPKLEFKCGLVENTVYDAAGIKAVAEIPPRAELLSRLLGSFKSPMSTFARVVSQIAEKKGGGKPDEAAGE